MIFRRRGGNKPPVIDASSDDSAADSHTGSEKNSPAPAKPVVPKRRNNTPLVIDTTENNSENFVAEPNNESVGDVSDSSGVMRRRRPDVMVQDFTVDALQPQTDKAEMLVEFVHIQNKLKKKVGEGASGFDPGVFVKANEAVKNLAASYIDGIVPKEMRELGYMFQSLEHFPERSGEQVTGGQR